MSKQRRISTWIKTFAAAALPLAVAAAPPPQAVDPAELGQDQRIQKLKEQALDISWREQLAEREFVYPSTTRVSVYIGETVPGMLLREVSVNVDNAAPVHYEYSELESIVLQQQGLHRLFQVDVAPGPHNIHAEFHAQYADHPGDSGFKGHFDSSFEHAAAPQDVELDLSRNGFEATPSFKFHAWVSGEYTPGGNDDPRVRNAQYLGGNKKFLSAAAVMEQVQAEEPDKRLSPDFYHDLAGYTLGFGMPDRAEAVYREQVARSSDSFDLARARLRLADFLYQRGYLQQAYAELSTLHEGLPKQLLLGWQDLTSRVLLAQGRYGDAAKVLMDPDNVSDQTPYMRYNLGIALLNDGRTGQGVNVLDRVGRLSPTDSDTLALRDKANLTLAYHFLRDQQGGTSIPLFNRVRTVGPYSNRALLGMGWAYLAPQGQKQKKVELGDEAPDKGNAFGSFSTIGVLLRPGYVDTGSLYQRAHLAPFRFNKTDPQEEIQFKQALVPWVELVGRDPMDPAVQEGMLAIPYTLERLGAHIQAQQYYERAIQGLEQTRNNLDRAIDHARSGVMVETMLRRDSGAESGWAWRLVDLPGANETYYLQSLLAGNRFQEALKDFRDVRLLRASLTEMKKHLADMAQAFADRNVKGATAPATLGRPPVPEGRAPLTPVRDLPDKAPALRMDDHLSMRGEATPDWVAAQSGTSGLTLANSPQRFEGVYEHMRGLSARIDALLPQLAEAETAQGKLLESIAIDELEAQKKTNEKYLVESRFALARIYDRSLKGDSP